MRSARGHVVMIALGLVVFAASFILSTAKANDESTAIPVRVAFPPAARATLKGKIV